MLNGFDFSHWQRDNDIKAYLPHADFIIHKASEGETYKDPTCIPRCNGMFKNIPTIIYHYVRADKCDPLKEAYNFMSVYEKIDIKPGLALDIEYSKKAGGTQGKDLAYVKKLVSMLSPNVSKRIIIYIPDIYPSDWYKWIREEDLGLWIARYRSKYPDHACDFWQYTSKPVDQDYFYGSYSKLKTFI